MLQYHRLHVKLPICSQIFCTLLSSLVSSCMYILKKIGGFGKQKYKHAQIHTRTHPARLIVVWRWRQLYNSVHNKYIYYQQYFYETVKKKPKIAYFESIFIRVHLYMRVISMNKRSRSMPQKICDVNHVSIGNILLL